MCCVGAICVKLCETYRPDLHCVLETQHNRSSTAPVEMSPTNRALGKTNAASLACVAVESALGCQGASN